MRLAGLLILAIASGLAGTTSRTGQGPSGLAARALANPDFRWTPRTASGIRAYFLEGTYAHARMDSLVARLPVAVNHARSLIGAPPLRNPVDVFFVDSREQMRQLTGSAVTGFAHMAASAVFIVTNPEWRAFDRHEIMHVVAAQTWGPIGGANAWLQEGLAQAAQARCGDYDNEPVAIALANRHGWIDIDTMITRFREQSDLRAYLQAAAFVAYLLRNVGAEGLAGLWHQETVPATRVRGRSLAALEAEWRASLPGESSVPASVLDDIEAKGCG